MGDWLPSQLQTRNLTKQMCNRLVRYCALLLVEAPLSRGVRSFHKGYTQPGYLGTPVVSMLGLLVLLWHFIDASRTP